MANAYDLGRLAQEMASAYEERVQRISAIKQETADLLGAFGRARDEMAKALRTELAKVKPELESAEGERKAADQAEIREREAYIRKLLDDFDEAHKEMSKRLRAELAKVKPELASAESDRKAADQDEIREREAYIRKLLDDFDEAHKEMAERLRAELAKVKPELASAESDRKAADQDEIRERKEAVRSMLEEFKNEHAQTTAAWKELLASMQSTRGHVVITGPAEVEAAVELKPVEEAVEEPEEAIEEEVEAEEEEEVEEEEIEGREELKDRIVKLLRDSPNGLKMTQIAEILGIENWRFLIPMMRELLDEEGIEKEGTLYFA